MGLHAGLLVVTILARIPGTSLAMHLLKEIECQVDVHTHLKAVGYIMGYVEHCNTKLHGDSATN